MNFVPSLDRKIGRVMQSVYRIDDMLSRFNSRLSLSVKNDMKEENEHVTEFV